MHDLCCNAQQRAHLAALEFVNWVDGEQRLRASAAQTTEARHPGPNSDTCNVLTIQTQANTFSIFRPKPGNHEVRTSLMATGGL
jgi:hypothetical protein